MTCGAIEARLNQSPNAEYYKSEDMVNLISNIRNYEVVPNASDILGDISKHLGAKSVTLLIDEVEAIWAKIADEDDWGAFEDKIEQIRRFGTINAMLLNAAD